MESEPTFTAELVAQRIAWERAHADFGPTEDALRRVEVAEAWERAAAELEAGRPVTRQVLGARLWEAEGAVQSMAPREPLPGDEPDRDLPDKIRERVRQHFEKRGVT